MTTLITRVFVNGNSQAVRIPAELRLDAERVEISRTEHGDLLLHPIPSRRGAALLQALRGFDEDFVAALEEDRTEAAICRHYAEQFTRLKAAGTPIGANDLWIGCHAMAESATLVNNNEAEFRRLDGLRVENWVVAV
jgi:antitoxin VapB